MISMRAVETIGISDAEQSDSKSSVISSPAMQVLRTQQQILTLLRAEFRRERDSGFALLRQIPSTGIRRFVDRYCALGSSDADLIAESSAHWGLATFFPYDAIQPPEAVKRANELFAATPTEWIDLSKYQGVRELRAHLAFVNSNPECDNIPRDVRRRMEAITPVKSPEIRKVVKLAFAQMVSSLHVSHRGGLWQYDGRMDGRDITVNIDYHQKYAQFEYGITHPLQSREVGKLRVDLSYEGLLGVGRGAWDLLEQSNLDQSIALLRNLITRCHRFLDLIPGPHENTDRTS
jgi:hypothetical protein